MQDANLTLYCYRRFYISLCICMCTYPVCVSIYTQYILALLHIYCFGKHKFYISGQNKCVFKYNYAPTHISKRQLITFCFVCIVLFFNQLLRKKQEEMQQKDLERKRMMEEQNKERVRQHLEARKHADARHANAVANFHELMRKREEDYNKRQEVP